MPRKLCTCQPAASPRHHGSSGGCIFSDGSVLGRGCFGSPEYPGCSGVHRCLRPASLEQLRERVEPLQSHRPKLLIRGKGGGVEAQRPASPLPEVGALNKPGQSGPQATSLPLTPSAQREHKCLTSSSHLCTHSLSIHCMPDPMLGAGNTLRSKLQGPAIRPFMSVDSA